MTDSRTRPVPVFVLSFLRLHRIARVWSACDAAAAAAASSGTNNFYYIPLKAAKASKQVAAAQGTAHCTTTLTMLYVALR